MEADFSTTDLAMGNQARYSGDETLLVRFYSHPRLKIVESESAQRPIYRDTDYVEIMQPGNKDSIVKRPATKRDKNRFAEQFRKYQARESQEQIEGTLLQEWPAISRAQCEELKFLNIRTVEQLASVSDSNAQHVMGVSLLKEKAKKFLLTSKDVATTQALADSKAEMAELRAQMDELLAAQAPLPLVEVAELEAPVAAPQAEAKIATRPSRRKKAEIKPGV